MSFTVSLVTWASQREPKIKNALRYFCLRSVTNRLVPKPHACLLIVSARVHD